MDKFYIYEVENDPTGYMSSGVTYVGNKEGEAWGTYFEDTVTRLLMQLDKEGYFYSEVENPELADYEFYIVKKDYYIKRLILIQEDNDGTIHAASTGPDTPHLALWNDDGDKAVEFDAGFIISDSETWSDWCHMILMMFHNTPS